MKIRELLANWLLPNFMQELKEKQSEITQLENAFDGVKALALGLESDKEDLTFSLMTILEENKSELERSSQEYSESISAYQNTLGSLVKKSLAFGISYKEIYDCIREQCDSDGFGLYHEAEKITGINIFNYFATEDNLGYFEDLDGHGLIVWLEQAAFGEMSWIELNSPYEKAVFGNLDKTSERYIAYEKELFKNTVEKLINTLIK